MKWFLRFLRSSLRESRQAQTLKDSSVTNSTIHQTQAGRDALSFPNAEQVLVVYNGWFGLRQIATGVDWDWAARVIKEQRAEVRNRLKYVLRDRAPMTVELSEQPEWVNLPALESDKKLTIADQDSESLDPGKLMIEVFGRDDIDGKLLILGTPGAGKTTVLLSLAEQLLAGAIDNPKTVIPIVFELSTWKKDDQSIRDWLIEQLYDLYGGDRKLKRYEQWLEQRVLLPLLDGLDELGMERQQKCMAKLNEFTRQYPQVVVCCRSKEFEESGIRLGNLRGAVELEPLSDQQILTYVQQVEREGLWRQIQDTPEMRQMLEPIEGEAGLLRVPLFMSIAASIFQVDQPFRTKGELLERYIDRQLSFDVRMSDRRRGLENRKWSYATVEKEPERKLTRQYLAWLSQQLNEIKEVNFLIEEMQPSWLKNESLEWYYWILLLIMNTLVAGLVAVVAFLSWDIPPHISFWSIVTNQVLLFIALSGGFILSTESKADGSTLMGYPIVLLFCFFFKKRLPIVYRHNIPILHSINLSTRIRLKLPSIDLIKSDVIKPSLASSDWLSNSVLLPIFILVPLLATFLRLLQFKTLSDSIENLHDSIFEEASLFADEMISLGYEENFRPGYRHQWIVAISIAQYAELIKTKGGWMISSLFNLVRMLPFLLTLLPFLIVSFIFSIFAEDIKQSELPNQGLREAMKILFWILVLFCTSSLITHYSQFTHYRIFPLCLGLLTCFSWLSLAKHLCLRSVLCQAKKVPWNYARFLNYCTERRLLQGIGGRYRFIHRELLEHFAKG